MSLSRSDFSQLKWRLLAFLSLLCACGAAIVASESFSAHAKAARQSAQRELDVARERLAAAEEDRKNMQAYTLEYGELIARNIIGDGQPLGWVESLEEIRKQKLVLNLDYSIAPQHPYTPPLDSGIFELAMSDMSLQLDLLHEGQLMDFFDALRASDTGRFMLDHCAMERNAALDATPLRATCAGGWLTLTPKATNHGRLPDGTTSHSTRFPKNGDQVAGYLPSPDGTTSHSTKPASGQVAGYLPEGEGDRVSWNH